MSWGTATLRASPGLQCCRPVLMRVGELRWVRLLLCLKQIWARSWLAARMDVLDDSLLQSQGLVASCPGDQALDKD